MQGIVVCDERGRVTLGRYITEKLGRKFHVVVMPNEVVLMPVTRDPLKDLAELGRQIPKHLTRQDLRKIAGEEAMGGWARVRKLQKKRKNEKRR